MPESAVKIDLRLSCWVASSGYSYDFHAGSRVLVMPILPVCLWCRSVCDSILMRYFFPGSGGVSRRED